MRPRNKLKALLVVVGVLALGAGVFAGMVVSRLPDKVQPTTPSIAPTSVSTADHSELADELQLRSDQRDQMRSIWEGVRTKVHDTYDAAQALQRKRDDAIVAILTPEQKAKYNEVTKQTADDFAKLAAQRKAVFDGGVDETRKLLDDGQRQKYDRILRGRIGAVPQMTPNTTNVSALSDPK